MPPKPKKPLLKTLTEHKTQIFSKLQPRKKLLQELSQKMTIIMPNNTNSKIVLLLSSSGSCNTN